MPVSHMLAFAGHMIDLPGRVSPRFPAYAEHAVRLKLRAAIERLAPAAAVSSVACGGDILFAEEILRYGASLYVVLPFQDRESFIHESVIHAGVQWVQRFEYMCARAAVPPYAVKSGAHQSDHDFAEGQRALTFFALGFSRALSLELKSLILYDEAQAGDQIGGTRSFVRLCTQLHIQHEQIDLAAIRCELQYNVMVQ